MSVLAQFLTWLTTYADHVQWLVLVREITRPASPTPQTVIVYGGNFIDAFHYAAYVGGFVSQSIP